MWMKELVLKPLGRRFGTVLAGWIVFGGDWSCQHIGACGLVNQSGAELVATWVVAAGLVCFDLMVSWAERLKVARKAAQK